MINQQDIANITAMFEPAYAELVTSDFVPQTAMMFGRKHNLIGDRLENLQDGILLYFLAVFTKDDLIRHLANKCGLLETEATALATALLASLPPGYEEMQAVLYEQFNQLSAAPAETADTSIHDDIAEAEAALESLPQVRTMAGDMHTNQPPIVPPPEPTITATPQDTLLAKPTPPTVSDTPRWDSDTNH